MDQAALTKISFPFCVFTRELVAGIGLGPRYFPIGRSFKSFRGPSICFHFRHIFAPSWPLADHLALNPALNRIKSLIFLQKTI